MTYTEAERYVLGTIDETVSRRQPHRLERMRAFLDRLGAPHLAYPTLHVGGTSGKGSTAAMLAGALSVKGKRTGLHTKPHLTSMTERARIDGAAISEQRFGALLGTMLPAIEALARDGARPSYYETLLALAFLYFAQERVDAAVIEVGIGGTLDGTNLIAPDVCVITSVGLDHTEILGNTVEEIARDKAGIAKPGVPLVCGAIGSARDVIATHCRSVGAPFVAVDDVTIVEPRRAGSYAQAAVIRTARGDYDLTLPVLGAFQQRNAATSIAALERLPVTLQPTVEEVERAMSRLALPGRMEFLPGCPGVVFDVAHNPDKAVSLSTALADTFSGRRFSFVIAIGQTKDAEGVLGPLLALPGTFTFTSFDVPGRRAESPVRLAQIASRYGVAADIVERPLDAFERARHDASADGIVVVTGSTVVTGKLREWWLARSSASVPLRPNRSASSPRTCS